MSVTLLLISSQAVLSATNTASRVPQLKAPITLVKLDVWRDGGSLGFVIRDAIDTNLSFMVDGKIGSSTRGHFFLYTEHIDFAKGVQLDLGGEEENQIIGYLALWLDANFDRKKLDVLFSHPDFRNMPKAEFNAYHVKHLIDNRQKMIQAIRDTQQTSGGDSTNRADAVCVTPQK